MTGLAARTGVFRNPFPHPLALKYSLHPIRNSNFEVTTRTVRFYEDLEFLENIQPNPAPLDCLTAAI